MRETITKAPNEQQLALEALLAQQEASVQRAFRTFLADARSEQTLAYVRGLIERGQISEALSIANNYVAHLGDVFPRVFTAAGYAAAVGLAEQLGERSRIAISFDPTHPRAAALMRVNRMEFVNNFSAEQFRASQAALTEALEAGAGPLNAARAIRASIGLTAHQWAVVRNYQRLLERGSSEALNRQLRDRRYDATVARVIDSDDLLSQSQIERMVGRYTNNLLAMRAETIARTETQRILNQARQESVRQNLDKTGVDPQLVRRTWRATKDHRTRDTHAEMDGQVRGLGEPFDSSSGAQMMYPGDASLGAPPEELINCRCVLTIDIAQSESVG